MTNQQIKVLADKASKLSGMSLPQLRDMVRQIRTAIAEGEDRNDVIPHVCGEDGEDHMDALRALAYACC